ncbi:MAG: hypothetical protein KJ583_04905 [Nanoarchaeota archaeon]|nr:hypothetical protein [Nanoarchaeota archaeon]MBU1269879.1 hypothetical protein [Nanoarchaeota archaeon]MBU1604629.1 hypothetical protein [Nanoarchaeota archaeon]MBU2443054.1 hypothetical protein [Nanoarchaeota archaeon]
MVEVIPVPRCPKCDYALTLLEKRDKYKCALCDGIYTTREIDLIQFHKWNKREKEKDRQARGIKPKIVTEEVKNQYSSKSEQKRLDSRE